MDSEDAVHARRMAVDLLLLCMFLEDVTDFLKPDTANCTSTVCNRTIWASIVLAVNHLQAFFVWRGNTSSRFLWLITNHNVFPMVIHIRLRINYSLGVMSSRDFECKY